MTITIPGFLDAFLSLLNETFGLGLSLDVPWYVGPPIIGVDVLVYFVGLWQACRSEALAAEAPAPTFVALRHQSFEPAAGRLPNEAVPTRFGRRTVRHVEWNLSFFFSNGLVQPETAVRQQTHLATNLAAERRVDPDAVFGYYGIVHVPLQFLAGCFISTWPETALFELDRATGQWRELTTGKGPDLGLSVETVTRHPNPSAVVIRIIVSYDVPIAEVVAVVPSPYENVRLAIANPRPDAVTHYGQVEIVCAAFRDILDNIHARVDKSKTVHVFYAGPVSLGFSLGRRISRTIHHRVVVYNYTARAMPPYAWGVEVNGDTAAPLETMVVRPTSRTGGPTTPTDS